MKRVKESSQSRYQVWSPCFGFFLQGAVKSLAITDVGIQIGMLVCITTGVLVSLSGGLTTGVDDGPFKKFVKYFIYGYCYIYHILNIPFSKSLYFCAAYLEFLTQPPSNAGRTLGTLGRTLEKMLCIWPEENR
ncbi:uncharacterized protein LOC118437251 [Folsomia candida]|uniref:uncharacterized protein LOC118437251 n=1 Tax=Folsomia candida TaxID=158441 RepID=UPI001604BF1D|nr:uncharacterized protein LOC118437251 [Folsomia candida]